MVYKYSFTSYSTKLLFYWGLSLFADIYIVHMQLIKVAIMWDSAAFFKLPSRCQLHNFVHNIFSPPSFTLYQGSLFIFFPVLHGVHYEFHNWFVNFESHRLSTSFFRKEIMRKSMAFLNTIFYCSYSQQKLFFVNVCFTIFPLRIKV